MVLRSGEPHWQKAEEFLKAARICLLSHLPNASVSRSYYSMFHASIIALRKIGIFKKEWKHNQLLSSFTSELVVKRKVYPSHFKKYLNEVLLSRHVADYKPILISFKKAERVLKKATEFLSKIEEVSKL